MAWTGAGGGICGDLVCCCPFPLRGCCEGEEDNGSERGRGDRALAVLILVDLVSLGFLPSPTPSPKLGLEPAV